MIYYCSKCKRYWQLIDFVQNIWQYLQYITTKGKHKHLCPICEREGEQP